MIKGLNELYLVKENLNLTVFKLYSIGYLKAILFQNGEQLSHFVVDWELVVWKKSYLTFVPGKS